MAFLALFLKRIQQKTPEATGHSTRSPYGFLRFYLMLVFLLVTENIVVSSLRQRLSPGSKAFTSENNLFVIFLKV